MKPLNLIALLLFLGGAVWALTQSDRSVREIQSAYFRAISPFLKSGSKMETQARAFLEETRHSKELETELEATREQLGRLRLIESQFRSLEYENVQLRHALDFKKATHFDVVAARVIRRTRRLYDAAVLLPNSLRSALEVWLARVGLPGWPGGSKGDSEGGDAPVRPLGRHRHHGTRCHARRN